MDISQNTFIVVGTGISGIAATELLLKRGAKVYLYDSNACLDVAEVKAKHPSIASVEILLEQVPQDVMSTLDIAVLSPGVPTDIPLVETFRTKGIAIWGEIELAYVCGKGRIAAITGTNGKTTTTSLVGHIMSGYFSQVKVVGNIGIPYTRVVDELTEESVVVAEISSFQLETAVTFAPKVSAILNITPDHLNRHHTMENYIAAKESITKNQGPEDICVLNYNDAVLRAFGATLPQKVIYFSSTEELCEGLYVKDKEILWARDGKTLPIISVDEMQILGAHNYENAMAAIAMCDGMGVPMDYIVEGLRTFQAVEHRIEYVCKKRGIAFYNDSKGTNPDAAIKGILAMNRRTVLIGGGYDKESTYDEWIESFGDKVKKLVLIGQTREKIAACAKAHGFTEYVFADSLEEAIDIAYETAVPGEAVLLSPACASWGMFDNYEQRGDIFKEYVRSLKE
ncbi:MAG: UDP-N-acetylmuramoyl-L-alanine--D-glutamate ligase [Lachnospiraceae bacterium]|nr:UDP-N-acetylmuramoyl-L-alanine--D-glutamate ligase [Lachnospiraceae bacterium]